MTLALTKEEDRLQRRLALYDRCHGPAPDCYRAIAEWWRINAEESANPDESLECAANMDRLADDITTRPAHYRYKPKHLTDAQWSKLPHGGGHEAN